MHDFSVIADRQNERILHFSPAWFRYAYLADVLTPQLTTVQYYNGSGHTHNIVDASTLPRRGQAAETSRYILPFTGPASVCALHIRHINPVYPIPFYLFSHTKTPHDSMLSS
jgi:hypothetical protein